MVTWSVHVQLIYAHSINMVNLYILPLRSGPTTPLTLVGQGRMRTGTRGPTTTWGPYRSINQSVSEEIQSNNRLTHYST